MIHNFALEVLKVLLVLHQDQKMVVLKRDLLDYGFMFLLKGKQEQRDQVE